jgi:hypothetical protein
LEHRRRAIVVPGRWRSYAALRGMFGPILDTKLARDPKVQRALVQLENR